MLRRYCPPTSNSAFVICPRLHTRNASISAAKTLRLSVMRNIQVPVPSLTEQNRLVATVQALEQNIADAQAVIASAPAPKQAVLQRYL